MERGEREASPGRGELQSPDAIAPHGGDTAEPRQTRPTSADLRGTQFKKHRPAHLGSPLGLSSAPVGGCWHGKYNPL